MRAFVNPRQYKWLPWIIIGMAVLTVATVVLALHYVENRLIGSRGESLSFAASEIADKLDLLLTEQRDATLELSRTQVFRKDSAAAQSAFLTTVKATRPIYLWLGVTDAAGRIVAATDPVSGGQDRSRSSWFQASRDIDGVYVSAPQPFEETGGIDAISFTTPIKGADGKFQGTVTTRVGLPALEEVLTHSIHTFRRREEFAGSIEYQFMNYNGMAFMDSDLLHKGNVNLKQLGLPSALLSESGQPGYVEELHKRRHVPVITGYAQTRGFSESPDLKWTILLRMDQSDLLAPIRKVLWTLGMASLLIGGPLFITLVWSTTRLKQEWALAQEEHARAILAEANYRLALRAAQMGTWSWDTKTGHVSWSNTTEVVFGLAPGSFSGTYAEYRDRIHPDDRALVEQAIAETVHSGKPYSIRHRIVWPDGTVRWLSCRGDTLRDEDNRVVQMTGTVLDITERKQAEDALRTNEQRMRAILDGALDAVVSMDERGVITDWNPQAEAIFGWSRNEAIGQHLAETIIPPRYREQHHHGMRNFLTTGEGPLLNRRIEISALRRDGTEFPVELTVSHSMQGDSRRFTAFVADITERKRTEAALRESETQMRLFMEATADCIWNWDLAAACIARNIGFERLFGYAADEIVPTIDWWAERLHTDDRERVMAAYRDAVASGRTTCSYEYRFRRRDGSYAVVTDHVFIVRDGTGKVVRALGAMTDITERKQADEALRESERRFRTIFDQAPIGMAVINSASGQFRRINQKYCEIVGYPHKEMLARTLQDITHPDDLQAELDNMKCMMEGRIQNFQMEKRYIRKDGAVVWGNLMCVSLGWDHETDRRFHIAMVKDITERKRAEEGLRQRSRQQAIEAELSLLAATVPDLSNLLNAVTKMASNALEVDYCEVLELLPNGSELRLCASAGWKDDPIGQVWTAEAGSMAYAVLQSNKPVVRTLPDNTRFGGPPWLHKHGAIGVMHVSIPGKESPWGVLGVYAVGGRAFSRDDINFLQTISSILATAIERMQAEDVLRSANQALRTLSQQLLQVQEEDRRTIARDLHDEIGQSLTAIKLNVERAQRTSDRAVRDKIMKDCIQTTDSVLNQVRNLSLDLHPSILDDLGLAYALKWYADRQAERAGLKVEVTADPSGPRLPQDVEIACFRIVQEALTNVVRHAQASRASITMKRLAKRVELCIQDNGIGFDVRTAQSPMGGGTNIGLTGMRERARLVGGEVHVKSALKKGTEVTAIVPLLSAPSAHATTPQVPPP